jgi:hypothetical protein
MAEAPRLRVVDRTTPWAVVDSRVAATGTQAEAHGTRVLVLQVPRAVAQHCPDRPAPSQMVAVLPGKAHKLLSAADILAMDTIP